MWLGPRVLIGCPDACPTNAPAAYEANEVCLSPATCINGHLNSSEAEGWVVEAYKAVERQMIVVVVDSRPQRVHVGQKSQMLSSLTKKSGRCVGRGAWAG
jgi:hypothetical protein